MTDTNISGQGPRPNEQSGRVGIGRPIHNTTQRPTNAPTSPNSLDWIKVDIPYFKTIPGIIKLLQWILGILCMAFGSGAYYAGQHFFLFVVVLTFIITFLWICIYLFTIRESLQLPIPWIILEFYYTAGATFLYFIAMIVEFATSGRASFVAAAVFGLFNTIAYGAGAFLLFKDWKQTSATSTSNAPNVP